MLHVKNLYSLVNLTCEIKLYLKRMLLFGRLLQNVTTAYAAILNVYKKGPNKLNIIFHILISVTHYTMSR
jgi:hypothetical protein